MEIAAIILGWIVLSVYFGLALARWIGKTDDSAPTQDYERKLREETRKAA